MKILSGPSGIWCLGPSGAALLPGRFGGDGGVVLSADGWAELARTGVDAPRPASRVYSLTVVTSTACNLGCPYCFQNVAPAQPGRFDPPRIPRSVLSPDTVDKIVAFAAAGLTRLDATELFILLFGGEPLLHPDGCRKVLRQCGEIAEVHGSMVTNGVLLTAGLAAELYALGLRSAQITLDGPAGLHDGLRYTRAGHGTFDRILDNVTAVQRDTGIRVDFRINVTPATLPHLASLVDELAGRVAARRCTLQVAPVLDYAGMFRDVLDRSDEDVAVIVDAYARALERGFQVPAPTGTTCRFCGERDGRTGAVINADGTLYSCWETIGKPGWEVGTLDDGYADYPDGRWVSCGGFAAANTTPAAAASANRLAFDDQLTVAVLELLRAERWRRANRDRPAAPDGVRAGR